MNIISVIWIGLISVFMVIPPNELVLWTTGLICLFMVAYRHFDGKNRFIGPVPADEAELRRLEAKLPPDHTKNSF